MTERLRQLLDDAVDGLEPQDVDPVGSVLRRGADRARRAAMAGATMAVLAVSAITVGGLVMTRPEPKHTEPPPLRTAGRIADTPPAPRVTGGKVIAGGLEMPIAEGLHPITEAEKTQCGGRPSLKELVTLVRPVGEGCYWESIDVIGSGDRTIDRMSQRKKGSDGVVRMAADPPVMITLPGGEPAWLSQRFDDKKQQPPRPMYWNVMVMPWSLVTIDWFVDGPTQRKMVAPMRSTPIAAGVLTLPETATNAYYAGPGQHGELTDPARIATLLQALGAQTDVVENADACAKMSQKTAQITFLPAVTELTRHYSAADPTVFRVVIALGDECQEAVSSHGGRVRLTDAAVTELKTIFGIGAR